MKLSHRVVKFHKLLGLGLVILCAHLNTAFAGDYAPFSPGTGFDMSNLDLVWQKILRGEGALFRLRVSHVGYTTGCDASANHNIPSTGIFGNCSGAQGMTHLMIQGTDDRGLGDQGKVTVAIASTPPPSNGFEAPGRPLSGCERVAFLAQSNPSRYRMLVGGNWRALGTQPQGAYYRIANWTNPSDPLRSTTVYCALITVQ